MAIHNDNIILYIKGTITPYVEMLQEWSPITPGVWETKDLSIAPFNIPPSAILEIVISNSTTSFNDPAYSGGVRAVGSSIDRTIEIHPAEQGGKNFAVMHVASNASSQIETFAENTTFNQFTLIGYWIEGQYVEISGTLSVTSADTWQGRDLTSFGVPAGAIVEVLLGNVSVVAERSIGVRASGSILERRFDIHEAEDNGVDSLTLFTNTTSESSNIEIYGENTTDATFILLGYWATPPLIEFVEAVIDIGDTDLSATWESKNLSALLPFSIDPLSVLEVVIGNDEASIEQEFGIRQNNTSIDRFLDLHEAEAGGLDFVRMHTNLDGNSAVEIYKESAASISEFTIAGYWQNEPVPISSLDLFIQGRRPFPQRRSRKIYFANQNGSIDRADLDGTSWESMIDPSHPLGPSGPLGLAIDSLGRHVYWTETGRDLIVRMGTEIPNGETALNRSDVEILMSGVAGIGAPQGLDIHVESGIMFFTTLGPNVLVSGHMDIPSSETFSTRTDLVQVGAAITASKVIVDEIEDKYYLAETTLDTIQRATLADSTRETIFDAPGSFTFGGIALDNVIGQIYFVDTLVDEIKKLAQDGTGDIELIFDSGPGQIATTRDLIIDKTEDQRKMYLSDSLDFIACINLDGTGFDRIIQNQVAPDFKTLINPNEIAILQSTIINDSISLFIHGPTPLESDIGLFTIGPLPASSGMNLFIVGPIPATSGLDMFVVGPVLFSGSMTLAGLRPSGFTGELDLFIDKKDLASGTITLFLEAPAPALDSIDLYIANSGVPLSFTGFMKGGDNLTENDILLFMRGTDTSGSVFFQDGSVNLYLKTIGDPTDSPSMLDTSIFMRVASGFLDVDNAWGLFLKSDTNFDNDLEMSITGTLGGTLVSGDITLFIESLFDNENWLLFLKTESGTQNTIDLFTSGSPTDPIIIQASNTLMISGIGMPIAEMDLFLFNEPPSLSGNITMFLATDPLVNEKSVKLYSHGF